MRTIPASETRLATSKFRSVHTKVVLSSVRETAWSVELTDLESANWVVSCEVNRHMDDPMASCTLRLVRNAFELSLSPLVTSKLNRVSGSALTLLQPRRRIEIYTQIAPLEDRRDDSGTWTSIFKGEIYDVDPGAGDDPTITIQALDLGAQLKRFFNSREQPPVERDRPNWYTALPWAGSPLSLALETFIQHAIDGCIMDSTSAWVAATVYALGDIRRPTTRNGFCYRCTTGGTSHATTEPVWTTTIGAVQPTDGTVVWTCHYDELPTLYVPSATGVNVQKPDDASPLITQTDLDTMIRGWVMASGMDLRMRYDEGTSTWRLTLRAADAGDTGPVFGVNHYRVKSFRYSDADVRNYVVVPWRDKNNGDRRTLSPYSDSDSRIQYGTQYFQLGEQDCVVIDETAEADALGARLLADLAWPVAVIEAEVPYYPWIDPGDTDVTLDGAGDTFQHPLWTGDAVGSCVGVSHHIEAGEQTTTIRVTAIVDGSDARVFDRAWLDKDVRKDLGATKIDVHGKPVGASTQTHPAACIVDAHIGTPQSVATDTWTKLEVDTIDRDLGGDFNDATWKFTAPMDGTYAFAATVKVDAMSEADLAGVAIGATSSAFLANGEATGEVGKAGTALYASCSVTTPMAAGDIVYVWGYQDSGSGKTFDDVYCTFSARRVS